MDIVIIMFGVRVHLGESITKVLLLLEKHHLPTTTLKMMEKSFLLWAKVSRLGHI
jgi:hypothetical protein